MGKNHPGYQQGNSYASPYRYAERTWADDMEWGATELFLTTGDSLYLKDAIHFARQIGATTWMGQDTMAHYEYYPFFNMAHWVLFPLVEKQFQDSLIRYYRIGLKAIWQKSKESPYRIGIPFLWCSNNLVNAVIAQGLLYEKMSGDKRFHKLVLAHRDWLLGRNPWGTSFFTGIPEGQEYPDDIHTSIWVLSHRPVRGGLVDGPVRSSIFRHLKGIHLFTPDEFAAVQPGGIVYHDDHGDYATNEPTLDGTAAALFWISLFASSQGKIR